MDMAMEDTVIFLVAWDWATDMEEATEEAMEDCLVASVLATDY